MKRGFFISLFFLLAVFSVQAQDNTVIERLLEANEAGSEEEYEDMVMTLQKLQRNPLDLNTADFDSLKMLFLLSDHQIDQLLSFRKKYGAFLHLNELLLVTGIGKKDLENIRPFVRLGEKGFRERVKAVKAGTRQEVLVKAKISLPRQEGYKIYHPSDFKTREQYERKQRNRFQGVPLGTLVKYKAQVFQSLKFGLTLENDPGEAYFTKNQKTGFDFLSAYADLTTSGCISRLVVGDFRIQWGQGLISWGGFSSGKSATALGNEKSARGLSAYSSTDENRFFRGIAMTLRVHPRLYGEVFASYKKTDGNMSQTDTLAEEDMLSASLYESGYHRNDNECEKKHTLKEFTTGAGFQWNTSYFKAGAHVLYYHFRPSLTLGEEIYQQYNDKGRNRLLTGIEYKTGLQNIYFFGETAVSKEGAWATLNGVRFSGSSRIALCALYRRYDKKYTSRYASGFGEYSNTSNEEGGYVGVEITPVKGMKLNAYYDYFRFFSSRYGAFVPGTGKEALVELTYEHKRYGHLLRFKSEIKPEDEKGIVLASVQRKKTEIRYQFTCRYRSQWEFRTRLNAVWYKKASRIEEGYMAYQDIIYQSRKENFKLQFRLAYFDTDSYNSRIYSYENNVLYGYSFPAYYDRGVRSYVNMNWKPGRQLTLYLKSGFTYWPNREFLGSSVTKVDDNKLFDLTLQARLVF